MPFCEACEVEGEGTVCPWCGRTYEAAAAVGRAANRRRDLRRWLLVMVPVVGLVGLAVAFLRAKPSDLLRVQNQDGLRERIEKQGHTCRWVMKDAGETGREGWKVVQCLLDAGSDGPAWYVDRAHRVFAKNAAAKAAAAAPYPPEIPAWARAGVTCTMADYYDDCMAGIVIDRVRPVSHQDLPALQAIADQSLSFALGHSRDVAAKVQKCGVTSKEARCGQFNREMRAVEEEVAKQLAAQRAAR